MSQELKIQAFDDKQVRIVWDSEDGKYYFSVTDVIHVLTDQPDARGASTYWAVLIDVVCDRQNAHQTPYNDRKMTQRLHISPFLLYLCRR